MNDEMIGAQVAEQIPMTEAHVFQKKSLGNCTTNISSIINRAGSNVASLNQKHHSDSKQDPRDIMKRNLHLIPYLSASPQ